MKENEQMTNQPTTAKKERNVFAFYDWVALILCVHDSTTQYIVRRFRDALGAFHIEHNR